METNTMNRYEVEVTVHGIETEDIARDVMDSVVENQAWRIDDASYLPETLLMQFKGIDRCRAGETDEQMVDKIAWAIWLKTKNPNKIDVVLTKIDENPIFDFSLGSADYDDVMSRFKMEEPEPPVQLQIIRLMPQPRIPEDSTIQGNENEKTITTETRKLDLS